MNTCFVCNKPLKGEITRVSSDKARHAKCKPGSSRWLNSEVGVASPLNSIFAKKGLIMKSLAEMTTAEIVEEFNANTDKPVKKFQDRATAERRLTEQREVRIAAAREKAVKPVKPVKPAKAPKAKKPAPEGRTAQHTQNRVKVGDTEYRSVKAAFDALDLPLSKHIKFRMELKASKSATFTHNGVSHNFTVVEG